MYIKRNEKRSENLATGPLTVKAAVSCGPLHPRLPQVSCPVRLVVATVPMAIVVLYVPREHNAQAHNPAMCMKLYYDYANGRRRSGRAVSFDGKCEKIETTTYRNETTTGATRVRAVRVANDEWRRRRRLRLVGGGVVVVVVAPLQDCPAPPPPRFIHGAAAGNRLRAARKRSRGVRPTATVPRPGCGPVLVRRERVLGRFH